VQVLLFQLVHLKVKLVEAESRDKEIPFYLDTHAQQITFHSAQVLTLWDKDKERSSKRRMNHI
jgi:hypothetical protein